MAAEDGVTRGFDHFTAPGMMSVPVRTKNLVEGTTQSYKAGAPLKVTSGKLVTAVEDDTAGIVGFATIPASGTVNTDAPIMPAVPGIEFETFLEDGTSGGHALAQTDLFAKYGIAVTAAGLWYLDQAETSSIAAVVVEFVDDIGTTPGRVRARLLDTVTVYND